MECWWRWSLLGVLILFQASEIQAQGWLSDRRYDEGPGFRLGDRFVLHTGADTGLGYDLNPAYASASGKGAGRFHLGGVLAIANNTPQEMEESPEGERSKLDLRFDLKATYIEFFGSKATNSMRNIAGGTRLKLHALPERPFSFIFDSFYQRGLMGSVEPGAQYDNQNNLRSLLALRYKRPGRNMEINGGYALRLRFFDSLGGGSSLGSLGFLNSHKVYTNLRWGFFPKTVLTTEASFRYSISSCSMMHFRGTVGVEVKLTYRTTIVANAGYGGGWCGGYDPNYDSAVARAGVRFQFTPNSRFSLLYTRDFHDGITAHFYSADSVIAELSLLFAGRVILQIAANYSYVNLASSSDSGGGGGGGSFVLARAYLEYRLRDWIAFNLKLEYLGDFTGAGELVTGEEVGSGANRFVAVLGTRIVY